MYICDRISEKCFRPHVFEKIKTHILCSKTCFLFFENRPLYEVTWKNNLQPNGPQITIRRMRILCWIYEATNTHLDYVTHIAFPLQQWLNEERLSLTLYVHCLSCSIYTRIILLKIEEYEVPHCATFGISLFNSHPYVQTFLVTLFANTFRVSSVMYSRH